MQLSTILDQIDMGSIALPEFQRGYVWNRDQVRNLMTSLYRRHPVGSLLVWETQTDQVADHARGDGNLATGTVKLLLDGQQRLTGYSQPVALLLDEGNDTEELANRAGFLFFTDIERFENYVRYDILALEPSSERVAV